MIDYIKAEVIYGNAEVIKNNPLLDFDITSYLKTGEIKGKEINAEYRNLKFKIKGDNYIEMQGSLHKFWNENLKNYNDFTISALSEVCKGIGERFDLNAKNLVLRNVEFGVNVRLPFETKVFLNAIIAFKGKECESETFGTNGYLLRFKFGNYYELKIYDKGLQYGLNENVLRFEIKVRKMYYLQSKGIKISDVSGLLLTDNQLKLSKLLIKAFKELLIYDPTIDLNGIKKSNEREIIMNGRNPKYWIAIRKQNPNTYKKKRNRFRQLVLKYGKSNNQKIVSNLIESKLTELMQENKKPYSTKTFKSVPNLTTLSFPPFKYDHIQFDTSSIRLNRVLV